MPLEAPAFNDLLEELSGRIAELAQHQLTLVHSLADLLPKVDRQLEGPLPSPADSFDGQVAGSLAQPQVDPRMQPHADPEMQVARRFDLRRNYDYFADLDARLAELGAADGDSEELV